MDEKVSLKESKNGEKSPIRPLCTNGGTEKKRQSNVLRVMTVIVRADIKKIQVAHIRHITGLSNNQIYQALRYLSDHHSITKTYEMDKYRLHSPPFKRLYVSLSGSQFKAGWRFLRKHGLI